MAIYRSPSLGSQLLFPLSCHLLGHGLLLFCFSVPFEYSPWAQKISCPSLLKLLHSSSAKYRHGLQGGRHMFVNFILVLLTIIHTWRCKKPLLSNYIKPQLHGWFHQKALMDRKKHKHIYIDVLQTMLGIEQRHGIKYILHDMNQVHFHGYFQLGNLFLEQTRFVLIQRSCRSICMSISLQG